MEAVLSGNGDRAHAAARSHFGLSLSILEGRRIGMKDGEGIQLLF